MKYEILKDFELTKNYVSEVCGIADKNKKSFGFLPGSAYEEMAIKGQLWIALCEKGEIQGYLMFGGKMPAVKIYQIYVSPTSRGKGLGKLLIDNLILFSERYGYHTIIARVASDLKANLFWENIGFHIHRQEKGGKTTHRTINIRAYKLPLNDLLSTNDNVNETTDLKWNATVLPNQRYAIDLNPIFDITKNRDNSSSTQELFKMSVSGDLTLCLTPEFERELKRHSEKYPDDVISKFALNIPVISEVNRDEIDGLVKQLREVIFPHRNINNSSSINDVSDLSHIAYCIAAGIDGFITREKALLKANNTLRTEFGISILSPDELLPESRNQYKPARKIQLSSLNINKYVPNDYKEVIDLLNNLQIDSNTLNKLNLRGIDRKDTQIITARLDGKVSGILSITFPSKVTQIANAYLFVNEATNGAIGIIDHFLELCLRHKTDFNYRLDVHLSEYQLETNETAIRKGFLTKNNILSKLVCSDFISSDTWQDLIKSMKYLFNLSLPETMPNLSEFQHTGICITDSDNQVRVLSLFDFETLISPLFCFLPKRGGLLIPIRENYANGLIGNSGPQLSLLDSSEQVLMLEKAYFRSPSKNNYFKKGTIIAFYVSKTLQQFVGFARITYSKLLSVDEALMTFKRQGVLSKEELTSISDTNGIVHVFTFDNFFEFNKPVSFSKAKKMGLISQANLVSVEKIDHKNLKLLINEAF